MQALAKANAETLATIAERVAVKHGLIDNGARAAKGKPPKVVTGIGARETAIAAARWLYRLPEQGSFEGAQAVKKQPRPEGHRRALADFELLELAEVTANGGDDPELDLLLLAHAVERGGPLCDPTSAQYRPDTPALWYKPSRRGPRPLTDRRFDTLADRGQAAQRWMGEEGVTYHWVRHSLS